MRREKEAFVFLAALSAILLAFLALRAPEAPPVAFFAYGANMDAATMGSRAGGYLNSTPAVLKGFRLVFQAGSGSVFGVANLQQDAGSEVYGAVYYLSLPQLQSLDKSAGVPDFYRKVAVMAELQDGSAVQATAYVLPGIPMFAPPSRPTVLAATKGSDQFNYGQAGLQAIADAAAEAQQKSGE